MLEPTRRIADPESLAVRLRDLLDPSRGSMPAWAAHFAALGTADKKVLPQAAMNSLNGFGF